MLHPLYVVRDGAFFVCSYAKGAYNHEDHLQGRHRCRVPAGRRTARSAPHGSPHHAQAIKRLYPQADFAFGPATENGFFYDVDLGDTKLSDEDLANIEKEMKKICKENLPLKPFILPRDEAVKLMEERQEHYKIEHIADLADETEFSFYQQGEYVDMCIGPHLCYTKHSRPSRSPSRAALTGRMTKRTRC